MIAFGKGKGSKHRLFSEQACVEFFVDSMLQGNAQVFRRLAVWTAHVCCWESLLCQLCVCVCIVCLDVSCVVLFVCLFVVRLFAQATRGRCGSDCWCERFSFLPQSGQVSFDRMQFLVAFRVRAPRSLERLRVKSCSSSDALYPNICICIYMDSHMSDKLFMYVFAFGIVIQVCLHKKHTYICI